MHCFLPLKICTPLNWLILSVQSTMNVSALSPSVTYSGYSPAYLRLKQHVDDHVSSHCPSFFFAQHTHSRPRPQFRSAQTHHVQRTYLPKQTNGQTNGDDDGDDDGEFGRSVQMFVHVVQLGRKVILDLGPSALERGRQQAILHRKRIRVKVNVFDLFE